MRLSSATALAALILATGVMQITPASASEQIRLAQATTVKVTPRPAARSKIVIKKPAVSKKIVIRTPARPTNKVVVNQRANKTVIRTR